MTDVSRVESLKMQGYTKKEDFIISVQPVSKPQTSLSVQGMVSKHTAAVTVADKYIPISLTSELF